MAFTVDEQELNVIGGSKGYAILIATYTNTAGSTGGVIQAGFNTTNVAGSKGLRKITVALPVSASATPSEPQLVTTFDTTNQSDKITITTAANQTGKLFILGEYSAP